MNFNVALSLLVGTTFGFIGSTANSTSNSLPLDDAHLNCPLATRDLGNPSTCAYDSDCGCLASCGPMDGFTGSYVLEENSTHRIWNFTLGPGESTGMHRHDYDYHFVVKSEAQHAIFGPSGEYITDFWSSGEIGFVIDGDELVPTVDFMTIPRIHAAKNIGNTTYNGILYEFKETTVGQCDAVDVAVLDKSGASLSSVSATSRVGIASVLLLLCYGW